MNKLKKNHGSEAFLLDGIYVPSITVADATGAIDIPQWKTHLDHLIAAGVNGILLFGSIGEFFAYTTPQKSQAISELATHIAGRTQLLVGVSSTCLEDALTLIEVANQANVDAILSLPPYYFAPSPLALVRYFDALAQKSEAPLVLYNFPTTTGTDLTGPVVADLIKAVPAIRGIKDTVDCASHTRLMIDATRMVDPYFSVLSGFDEYYLTNRIERGNGVLSGLTNVEPETFVRMNAAYLAGKMDEVISCAQRISRLMGVYACADSFISAIKGGVLLKGEEIATSIKEPALQLTSDQLKKIKEILR